MADIWSSVSGFGDALNSLKAVGAAGGWAINDSGGQALISAAQDLHDELTELLHQTDQLAEELPLGTTPAAQVYKPYQATIASDPHQGLIIVLRKLQEQALEFKTEVEKAMAAYQSADEGSQHGIKKAGGPAA
ncbi:hypothetical protein C8D88_12316 [Lentzea atacamensis]|uniref:PE family protein n=1 Tax=Lentzea atacamensis TaxID=531938 RepID=A0A316HZZ5_9PSEU|nr:hypothetical protein [Lentzea atacamensis]PWK80652.1 hypothetical protein C8D88_12316 [Lentzea atacamensis]